MEMTKLIYPPVIDNSMPAFVKRKDGQTECRLYFSFSDKNSIQDIKSVLVSINFQSTNRTALKTSSGWYPTGIKIVKSNSIYIDNTRLSQDKYYIIISDSDLKNGFERNIYYKVQICFSLVSYANEEIVSWLQNHQNDFSEWSTFCLLRCISKPILYFKNINNDSEDTIDFGSYLLTTNGDILARLEFEDADEKEYLNWYKFILRDKQNSLLLESNKIYCREQSVVNEINYHLKYGFTPGEQYKLEIQYSTINNYQKTLKYDNFSLNYFYADKLNVSLGLVNNNETGSIQVIIEDNTDNAFFGQLIITRACSTDNFNIWEDVHIVPWYNNTPINCIWEDYSVESGLVYKYRIQKFNKETKTRGIPTESPTSAIVTLDDIFLCDADRQLKIKFNPKIDSFKFVVQENKIETLGNRYPVIRKNGLLKYRQFPISGLISFMMDDEEHFIQSSNLLNGQNELYSIYNDINRIGDMNDTIKEKLFRDQVVAFLYDDNVKLFRSATEGNILVKLSDINFQPENSLGRHIYSFSATANEIAENTFANYIKYNVVNLLDINSSNIEYDKVTVGQIVLPYTLASGQTTMSADTAILEKYTQSAPYNQNIKAISFSKVEIESLQNARAEDFNYKIILNGSDEIVITDYKIEYTDNDFGIKNLTIKTDGNYRITYVTKITYEEKTARNASIEYDTKIGQLKGNYSCVDALYSYIRQKYDYNYPTRYQKLINIPYLQIVAAPYTSCYVKDNINDKIMNRHVIGATGSLEFNDLKTSITNIAVMGSFLNRDYIEFKLDSQGNGGDKAVVYYKYIKSNGENSFSPTYYSIEGSKEPLKFYSASLQNIKESTEVEAQNVYGAIYNEYGVLTRLDAPNLWETISAPLHSTTNRIKVIQASNSSIDIEKPVLINGAVYALQFLTSFEKNIINKAMERLAFTNEDIDYQVFIKHLVQDPWSDGYHRFVYLNEQWYVLTENRDVVIDSTIALNYQCNLIRGVYYNETL